MATVDLTKDNFDQTVKENAIVVVDFWAPWCGPCRGFAPVYEKASEQHPDVVFAKVNTDEQQELAAGFGIRSIPTLMVFREKVILFKQAGALPGNALEQVITQAKALDMAKVHEELAAQPSAAGFRRRAYRLDVQNRMDRRGGVRSDSDYQTAEVNRGNRYRNLRPKHRAAIAQGLSRLLADTYMLYLKTHSFHWNVEGPMFQTLHQMFMEQYTETWNAIDPIAERIRVAGRLRARHLQAVRAAWPASRRPTACPRPRRWSRLLIEGQEAVARTARSVLPLADEANDQPTLDLLTQRMQVHEKNAWMLRSLLKK